MGGAKRNPSSLFKAVLRIGDYVYNCRHLDTGLVFGKRRQAFKLRVRSKFRGTVSLAEASCDAQGFEDFRYDTSPCPVGS